MFTAVNRRLRDQWGLVAATFVSELLHGTESRGIGPDHWQNVDARALPKCLASDVTTPCQNASSDRILDSRNKGRNPNFSVSAETGRGASGFVSPAEPAFQAGLPSATRNDETGALWFAMNSTPTRQALPFLLFGTMRCARKPRPNLPSGYSRRTTKQGRS
jgi:hypothetical protein